MNNRWYTAILLPYHDNGAFFERDAGLFCQGLRQNGVDSKLVALGEPGTHPELPLLQGSLEQLSDTSWWRQLDLEGVLLYSWALPRFEPVAQAIKQSGSKLVLIMDMDGLRSPREWFWRYLHVKYIWEKGAGNFFPSMRALAKTVSALSIRHHAGALQHLEHADLLVVPSALAKQRFARFLINCRRGDLVTRVQVHHHPVETNIAFSPTVAKEKLIISVGRWDALVKDAPLFVQVVSQTLKHQGDYRARIIGGGETALRKLTKRLPEEVRNRIEITGRVPHAKLPRHYQEAQIFLNTSYSESFNIAAAEALCCGCSVVGTAIIAAFNSFCSHDSGTLSCNRSVGNFRDALSAEIEAWRYGGRSAHQISNHWVPRLHVDRVAQSIIEATRTRSNGS